MGSIEMNGVTTAVRSFLVNEEGPTAVEYAIMLALILVTCITAVSQLGQSMFWNGFEDARDAATGNKID